jgi:hypothetical protein
MRVGKRYAQLPQFATIVIIGRDNSLIIGND